MLLVFSPRRVKTLRRSLCLDSVYSTLFDEKKGNVDVEFDIERAWKDEAYRQTLSEEQLQAMPENPAGELDEAALATACGAWGPGWVPPVGVGVPVMTQTDIHESSTGLICEVNVFTVNANLLIAIPIQLLSGPNSNCVGRH
jgi:mersacidin/lichenicidin family type 2 lantibiotic